MNKQVSVFKGLKIPTDPVTVDVDNVLEQVRNSSILREALTKLRKETDKAKRETLKNGLPVICFSGKFSYRNNSSLLEYSSLICLDFDDYTTDSEYQKDRQDFCNRPYVYAVFASPNFGLKVIVAHDSADYLDHSLLFDALANNFNNYHLDCGKDLSRACFFSYDPDLYFNPDAVPYHWIACSNISNNSISKHSSFIKPQKVGKAGKQVTDEQIIGILQSWFDKNYEWRVGMRNNSLFTFVCKLCKAGIPKDKAKDYLVGRYAALDFGKNEIEKIVESGYDDKNFGTTRNTFHP